MFWVVTTTAGGVHHLKTGSLTQREENFASNSIYLFGSIYAAFLRQWAVSQSSQDDVLTTMYAES